MRAAGGPSIKAGLEKFSTSAAIRVGRLLHRSPQSLDWFLRRTNKYLDWRDQAVVCKARFGAEFFCSMHDMIQRKIAYFGIWEPNLTAYLQRTLNSGDVFVDVGANIGYFSLLGSCCVGQSGKVIAIEASPKIFKLLLRNLEKNAAANVRAVNKAVAYEAGRISIFDGPSWNSGMSSVVPREGNHLESFVDAQPLHEILTDEERAQIRLLKIDVEGAEGMVLRSFLENIGRYGPKCELAVEVSPENAWILQAMEDLGFFAYLLENDYSDRAYLPHSAKAPLRHSGPVTKQSDFIFSRVNANFL